MGGRTGNRRRYDHARGFFLVALLAVLELVLALALSRLSAAYDDLTGRPLAARRTSPWLRSMRGEREELARKRAGISGVERVVVISVVAAVLALEIGSSSSRVPRYRPASREIRSLPGSHRSRVDRKVLVSARAAIDGFVIIGVSRESEKGAR